MTTKTLSMPKVNLASEVKYDSRAKDFVINGKHYPALVSSCSGSRYIYVQRTDGTYTEITQNGSTYYASFGDFNTYSKKFNIVVSKTEVLPAGYSRDKIGRLRFGGKYVKESVLNN